VYGNRRSVVIDINPRMGWSLMIVSARHPDEVADTWRVAWRRHGTHRRTSPA